MARTAAGRRKSVQNFPYSIKCSTTAGNSLLVGTAGTPVYNFERTQAFSFEYFIKPTSLPTSGNVYIFAECDDNSPFRGIFARISSTNFQIHLTNTLTSNEAQATYARPAVSSWLHCVISYSGNSLVSGIKYYEGRVLQAKTAVTPDNLTGTIVAPAGESTRWAAFSNGNSAPDAYFIPRRVFNYELSQEQINSLFYDNQVTGAAPLDEYPLLAGSGTSIASTGSSGNNITIVGSSIAWNADSPCKARITIPQNRLPVS